MTYLEKTWDWLKNILSRYQTIYILTTIAIIFIFFIILYKLATLRVASFLSSDVISINDIPNVFNSYLKTFAQLLGGSAILFGLYLTYRRINAIEENVRVAQESQITERYTRAVNQLRSSDISVRIGGLYGLSRIAIDSNKDLIAVIKVIESFLKQNDLQFGNFNHPQLIERHRNFNVNNDVYEGLKIWFDLANKAQKEVQLNNLHFANIHLDDFEVNKSTFQNLIFLRCDINELRLIDFKYYSTDLLGCNLLHSNFYSCKLFASTFWEGSINYLDFTNSKINYCSFRNNTILKSEFNDADWIATSMNEVSLKEVDFTNVDFKTSQWNNNSLSKVEFNDCNFHAITWDDKNWENITFKNCSFSNCNRECKSNAV